MERYTWVRFAGKLTSCHSTHIVKVSTPVGRWRTCQGRFKMQTRTYWGAKITSTRTAVGQFKGQFNGAMDEMSGKVQNSSTHPLRCQSHEHAHNSRSVQGSSMGRWNVTCRGSIWRITHVALPQHTTTVSIYQWGPLTVAMCVCGRR